MEVVEPNACVLVVMPDNMARVKKMYSRCRDRHSGMAGRRKKKYEGELITFERFETIYNAQGGVCVETGVPFDWTSKDLMPSPDRIDNDVRICGIVILKPFFPSELVTSCKTWNIC